MPASSRHVRPLLATLLAALLLVLAQPFGAAAAAQEQPPPDLLLTMALFEGDTAKARAAIAAGGLRRAENPRAMLQVAMLQGRPEIVRLILDAGVSGAPAAEERESPLFVAITGSRAWEPAARLEIVKLLLDHGARPTERMHLHMTTPGSALTYAAANAYADVVELLVARGASIGERDEAGHTLLALLAEASAMEVPLDDRLATARTLVRLGADPAARNADGETAADLAEARGSSELAALLRDRRALASAPAGAPRQRQRSGTESGLPFGSTTPEARLMIAVVQNDLAMARQAVEDGAEVNWRTEEGQTVLMAAASSARPDIVRLLLERGADVHATTRIAGGNAVNAAFEGMSYLALGGDGEAARLDREAALATLRLLVARRPNLDILVKYAMMDRTPLMGAIEVGAVDAARILLDAGANPNVANHGGWTALDYVLARDANRMTEAQRLQALEALIAAGADVNRSARGDVRPLQRARSSGFQRLAAALVRAGAQ